MAQAALKITERGFHEKGKTLRRNGEVPGIIYGEFLDKPIPIKMVNSSLIKLLNNTTKGSIIKLNLNDNIKNCVVKQVQKNPLSGELVHVDFQYVSKNEVIKMSIPVNYEGLEALNSKKLLLNTLLSEIEMQGDVEKIPEYIKVDVSKLDYNDKIFARDINLPDGVQLLVDSDTLLAVVNG